MENEQQGDSPNSPNSDRAGRSWANALSELSNLAVAFNTGIPNLRDLAGGAGRAANALGFLESGLEGLQGFSAYGVNFNFAIDEMIMAATRARMSLPELAAVVSESSAVMTRFGPTVQEGLDNFLNAQAAFFRGQDAMGGYASTMLQNLGFSVSEINETFLAFDAIQNVTRRREFRTVEERNRAATEFAMELDRLARLTGMERKEVAERLQANAREGNVLAQRAELESRFGSEMADSYDENLLMMAGFGEGIENLTKDILTRGFPVGESRRLAGVADDLTSALYAAKRAQESGDVDEYNRQMRIAAYEAAELSRSERLRRLSELAGYNEIGDISGRVFVDLQQGLARAMTQVADEARANGEVLSESQVLERARQRVAADQARQLEEARERESRGVTQLVVALRDSVYRISAETQQEVLSDIMRGLSDPSSGVRDFLRTSFEPQITTFFTSLRTGFDDLFNLLGLPGGSSGSTEELLRFARSVEERARELPNGVEASQRLSTLLTEYNRLVSEGNADDAAGMIPNIREAASSLAREVALQQNNIDAANIGVTTATITVTNGNIIPPNTYSEGTLGSAGRLFENFGNETIAALHGLEAVVTPEQMHAIVRNSAMGALSAVGSVLASSDPSESNRTTLSAMDRIAGNQVTSLQGMLNTVQNMSRSIETSRTPDFDLSPITEGIERVVAEIKQPITDAMNTLRQPMEQLARTADAQLDVQRRQNKGIRNMSGDMMRGLG